MPSDLDIRAYFATFTTYGTWLHGDERGSVDDEHNIPGLPFAPPSFNREAYHRDAMKWPEFIIDRKSRGIIHRTTHGVFEYRHWALLALNVRTNHLHLVGYAPDGGDKMINDVKAWCTRRLREAKRRDPKAPVWTEGHSVHPLFTAEAVAVAVDYTLSRQGADLPME
jgi:hypothetical protein